MENFEKYLAELDNTSWKFSKEKSENPFVRYYAPEIDENPALEKELASWYQSSIGMLRWMVEIGRVDIITKV